MEKKSRPFLFLLAAIVCFIVALLASAGVLLKNDTVGRIIFGIIWGALAIVWLGQYAILVNRQKHHDNKS